ncbi:unnamed protein product [Dicrocoelium dendriticum]|nr:unnamed protein product [Dicrocoelium dendriticum]
MASRGDGIQLLLQAEKLASDKVNEAKRRKAKRLKEAKLEAQAEIDAERAERERHFKMCEERDHKAGLHYKCTKVAEDLSKSHNCNIDSDVVCLATETLFRYYEVLATDLEAFAKHGRRTVINVEDVLLFVRRNPQLVKILKESYKCDKKPGSPTRIEDKQRTITTRVDEMDPQTKEQSRSTETLTDWFTGD